MTLPVLEIPPQETRYRATPKGRALRSRHDGAQSRYRRTYDGPPVVTVQWLVDSDQYTEILFLYREQLKNGALPFTLDLIIEDGLPETHTVRFVPGTLRLNSIEGETYTLTASLEVLA